MGRGKVQLKRIEDNSSRQVTFAKRRNGLIKKAQELAVLCDVDLALIIFSTKGRLSEYCSSDSINSMIKRYQVRMEEENAVRRAINEDQNATGLFDCPDLLQIVKRQLQGDNIDKLTTAELVVLEQQIDIVLKQTREMKTHAMSETVAASQEQEQQLKVQNDFRQVQVDAALNEGDLTDRYNPPTQANQRGFNGDDEMNYSTTHQRPLLAFL